MKIWLEKIWKYLAFLFAGFIAGTIAAIKLIEKPSVLNVTTDSFVAEQTQKIGKLKQRGEGNSQDTSATAISPGRKEQRIARRTARRESRLKRGMEKEISSEQETGPEIKGS